MKKGRKFKIFIFILAIYFVLIHLLMIDSFLGKYAIRSPIYEKKVVSPLPPKKAPPSKPQSLKMPPAQASSSNKTTEEEQSDIQIAQLIRDKNWDYSIAIRVAKSENFWNLTKSFDCTRDNAGTNWDGTVDVGLFAINSTHRGAVEVTYREPFDVAMRDCKKNLDFAYYHLYKNSGWNPWVSYKTGRYLEHTEGI